MDRLNTIFDRQANRHTADAARFAALDGDTCQLCTATGADKRNLILDCLYAVYEAVPEFISLHAVDSPIQGRGWYLRLCKACRGRLLAHLELWAADCRAMRDVPKDHDGGALAWDEGADIPIREHGTTRWISPAEWDARHAE